MNTILYCNHCRWSGDPAELVSIEDDLDNFAYCPQCEGDDFDEEEEEE